MAKRRAKKNVKKSPAKSPATRVDADEPQLAQIDKREDGIIDEEVQRKITAIRGIRDVEIEHLLTRLRLIRSYISEEQLQTPLRQFFNENLPNLSLVKNDKGQYEVRWKDEYGNFCMDNIDGRNIHMSLLRRMSMAHPDCSTTVPSLGGFDFSSKGGRTSLLGVDNLQIGNFIMEEQSDTQMLGSEAFQTPGQLASQRMSIGVTPKTLRLPKPGEMLLSVRGSPLGVYKEDNMEAINESEEG
ncbi:Borealin, C-terminal [Dillenia turbinata]|uniref:Borealin, C-terminal n=1 Tax=Dillenia turbinata TaxID=194707 RepID=A0AAN8Z347_9MAGN